ncbi:MAG: PP2C family protein-serine/threonine phosphatase [Acidobacteriaceae bacterium]
MMKEKEYPAHEILFLEGECGDSFCIVLEGQLAILKAMNTPNERLLAVRGVGEIIGEMSLLNPNGLRTASVRTETLTRLLVLNRADFDHLLRRMPSLAYEMLRVLSMRLNEAHETTIHDLTEKNQELEKAYSDLKAAQEQIIAKEILERELKQAREIQVSMLPGVLPRLDCYEIGARMVAARMVAGDFYDVILLDSDHLGLVIGDVAGKGVPAALFMALTRSLVRAEADLTSRPEQVLMRVNKLLLEMNAKGLFVTVLYGILHLPSGKFSYARAGHEQPLILDRNGELLVPPLNSGQVLGLFPEPLLDSQSVTLPPGGVMLMFTDGVTEARNTAGDFFNMDRLVSWLPKFLDNSAQGLCDNLVQAVWDFHGNSDQDDDITLLSVKTLL